MELGTTYSLENFYVLDKSTKLSTGAIQVNKRDLWQGGQTYQIA